MNEQVEIRLLLARFPSDTAPVVVGAIDRTIWDHWDDDDESRWRRDVEQHWGCDPSDLEWREVWGTFAPADLVAAFETPAVAGQIAQP